MKELIRKKEQEAATIVAKSLEKADTQKLDQLILDDVLKEIHCHD